MLTGLHIKNLALIEEQDIEFGPGLNILSGETGAGKSVLLGSLGLVLGKRANADIIRTGAEYALIEAHFSDVPSDVQTLLNDADIELEDDSVVITRRISAGKSTVRINSVSVTASFVREIASKLISVHGQHDTALLLDRSNYLSILDAYGDKEHERLLEKTSRFFDEYKASKNALDKLTADNRNKNKDMDYLSYVIDEISEAELVPGEDKKLEERYAVLDGFSKISEHMNKALALLSETESVDDVCEELSEAKAIDKDLSDVYDKSMLLSEMCSDLRHEIRSYVDNATFSEEEFGAITERLDKINNLKYKYGNEIEDILSELEKSRERFDELQNAEENIKKLEREVKERHEALLKACDELSASRKNLVGDFSDKLREALSELNFNNTEFEVRFEKKECSGNGCDEVSFLISTNVGEAVKSIDLVASGGELSRIMLALKSVMAGKNDVKSMIFDEIDAGISGITASMVAKKLAAISKNCQVICITHLPQIASMADSHYLIGKETMDNKTYTQVKHLSDEETIMELSRMLGGENISDNTVFSAREMKSLANKYKNELY